MIAYPVSRAVNSSRNDSQRSWNVYEPAPATCHFRPVILMFSRRQVETCDVDEPLASAQLTADRRAAIEFCGRISLVVDGYNDDPRELFEILEVRAYIKRLDQAVALLVLLPVPGRRLNQAAGELPVRHHRGESRAWRPSTSTNGSMRWRATSPR
jgi:hypothetical protein